jgi:23S rRNA (cytosine1962-C5)-methyltransferase
VRIHAAQAGFPILGDAQYGRARSGVPRVMLHAARLELRHPMTGLQLRLEAPTPRIFRNFDALVCAEEFRELLFDEATTNCHRLIASQADGFDGITADRFGEAMLVQTVAPHKPFPDSLSERHALFVQDLTPGSRTKPKQLTGNIQSFVARENGLNFLIRMDQGFSPGLFLDQRENRRHLREIARGKDVLNCFAYTCSFSVAAAAGGGKTTSLDLSKPYLDWGRDNFRANNLIPDQHDFIYGDVFDWLKRFAKRGRQWDIVLLDPPTFGTTKRGRVFRAARDYVELIQLAAKLVSRSGTLFCSTNQRSVSAKQFLTAIQRGLSLEKRGWSGIEFETQPFDFRVPEGEQPYLKTFWITLD